MSLPVEVQRDPTVQTVHQVFKEMQAWPHWPEIALGAQKEYGMTAEIFYDVLPEYQRFMALTTSYPGLGMLSDQVDQIWHAHLLNTIRYRSYCTEYIGRYVDHVPCSSYDVYAALAASSCTMPPTPPSSCTDPYPAPPDPSPVPSRSDQIHTAILGGSSRFIAAYTHVYECTPLPQIWNRAAEGFAG